MFRCAPKRLSAGAGCLAGIGCTVCVFVSDLTFRAHTLTDAKLGIVVASRASGVVGSLVLLTRTRPGP